MIAVAGARILQEVENTRSLKTSSSRLRGLPSQNKVSFHHLLLLPGKCLAEHLEKNLSQLENKIQFFRFAIKEIEDITR